MSARPAAAVLTLLAASGLSACESTQTRSARLRSEAKASAPVKGLSIARDNPDVRVTASAVVTDAKARRSAAVITLRNTSSHELSALPLLFSVKDAAGKTVFSNDEPGASVDLTTVPSVPARGTLDWVDDAIVNVASPRSVQARVGVAAKAAGPASPPRLALSGVKLVHDPIDGVTAVGRVLNDSTIPQERLVIFATARRGGRIVAAGRAVVPVVKPGPKGARFTVFFVGDPTGAKLELHAPPVSFGGRP